MDEPTSRACTGCGTEKPLTEFPRHKDMLYGRRPRCRDCWNAQKRAWRKANPESVRRTKKRQRAKLASQPGQPRWPNEREWARRPEVAERRKARARERSARLAARTDLELMAAWNRLRPDGLKECKRCHVAKPREAFGLARRLSDGRTRLCRSCWGDNRVRGRRVTGADMVAYWLANGMTPHACTYCGTEVNYRGSNPDAPNMHVDHIFPVLLGGTDELENLAPSCPSCNCSKGAQRLVDWLTAA